MPVPIGTTTVKFYPPSGEDFSMDCRDVMHHVNTSHQCITYMKEYENKSLEELRLEDYVVNHKGPQKDSMSSRFGASTQTGIFDQPASTHSFSFGAFETDASTFSVTSGTNTFVTGTVSFGQATQQQNKSLFEKPTTFGAAATTAPTFNFGTTPNTSFFGQGTQQKSNFDISIPSSSKKAIKVEKIDAVNKGNIDKALERTSELFGQTSPSTGSFEQPAETSLEMSSGSAATIQPSIALFGANPNGVGMTNTMSKNTFSFGLSKENTELFGAKPTFGTGSGNTSFGCFGTNTGTTTSLFKTGFGKSISTNELSTNTGQFGNTNANEPALSFGSTSTGFGGFGKTYTAGSASNFEKAADVANVKEVDSRLTRPPMMTFKQFLAPQVDGIDDQQAINKYGEYKLAFKRQQIKEFFLDHKDEEWFRMKYHPDDSIKRKTELQDALEHRLHVFMYFFEKGVVNLIRIDQENSEKIISFFDSVVITLEGGTEFDFKSLDESPEEEENLSLPSSSSKRKADELKSPMEINKRRKTSYNFDNFGVNVCSFGSNSETDSVFNVRDEAEGTENSEAENETEPPKVLKPRALHKTRSIFLQNLAPCVTKQEVETICKQFPGFLRVAIADPQPEKSFARRAWITFERSVDIKKIYWNLRKCRIRDTKLGAIVNKDLSRRIRPVNGITLHVQVIRSDLKIAAKMVQNLDKQRKLWVIGEDAEPAVDQFSLDSKNPLLKNVTDYLIEEVSAEEEELLGASYHDESNKEEGFSSEQEEIQTLVQVLDRLLLYLRVVHSVDYYNMSEYPNEDEMPNRCGIMHVRGSLPISCKVAQQEISEYVSLFKKKSQVFLQKLTKIDDEGAKLGKRNFEEEIRTFNKELKGKWRSPQTDKKVKGSEFIKTHSFNKHAEKAVEVKEVEYFKNYLMDPKRPQLPEHPSNHPPLE